MTLTMTEAGIELVFWGAVLFLIGLLQGVLIPQFKNSRMALSAHLTAVQCGMALMIFGVIWALVKLPSVWLVSTQLALIASVYLIWLGITISAVTGASKALPIAGEGFSAGKMGEHLVTAVMGVGMLLSVGSGIAIVIGLSGNL